MSDALTGNEEPEIEARLRLALSRVNRRLAEQEIALVRERIARNVELARRLSAVPLGNGDEPAHEFVPSRDALDDESQAP